MGDRGPLYLSEKSEICFQVWQLAGSVDDLPSLNPLCVNTNLQLSLIWGPLTVLMALLFFNSFLVP